MAEKTETIITSVQREIDARDQIRRAMDMFLACPTDDTFTSIDALVRSYQRIWITNRADQD